MCPADLRFIAPVSSALFGMHSETFRRYKNIVVTFFYYIDLAICSVWIFSLTKYPKSPRQYFDKLIFIIHTSQISVHSEKSGLFASADPNPNRHLNIEMLFCYIINIFQICRQRRSRPGARQGGQRQDSTDRHQGKLAHSAEY